MPIITLKYLSLWQSNSFASTYCNIYSVIRGDWVSQWNTVTFELLFCQDVVLTKCNKTSNNKLTPQRLLFHHSASFSSRQLVLSFLCGWPSLQLPFNFSFIQLLCESPCKYIFIQNMFVDTKTLTHISDK